MKLVKKTSLKDKITIKDSLSIQMKTSLWITYINLSFQFLNDLKAEKILEKRRRLTVATIIFSATCLDSFVNEIIGEYLVEEEDLVVKLPLHDKWRLVIMLISNSKIKKGDAVIGQINWLRKLRNDLVHYKAEFETLKDGQNTTSVNRKLTEKNAEKSFKVIKKSIAFFYETTKLDVPDSVYGWKIIK